MTGLSGCAVDVRDRGEVEVDPGRARAARPSAAATARVSSTSSTAPSAWCRGRASRPRRTAG